ncbi:MAG: hypothetical protein K5871_04610 [Lachnospiraceae bacterium]|nr:hypothetical protein [Lachnospiraceae bacterium]
MNIRKLLTRISSAAFAVLLCLMTPLEKAVGAAVPGFADTAMASHGLPDGIVQIDIYTAADLVELSENCHHEAWSRDKYVVLQNDISLEGSDFTSIPIFSGIFNGNGHVISGYGYDGTGYVTGFFRYVTNMATVQGLTLDADITAVSDGYVTGALAGINDGYVRKCTVTGNVSGISATGGMIGINGPDALVLDCENKALVSGFYYTGGIAGRNYGIIRRGINSGGINSTPEWAAENDERQVDVISEMTGDLSLISYQSGIDTGGLAGFSRGIILSSRNDAVVGYERVGYNIGGICGRHRGTIYSCTNNGRVYGKKDVGGIVGQQEPYIEVDRSRSVSDSIARIHALSNKAAEDAASATPDIIAAVSELQQASGRAMDDASAMTGDLSEYRLEEDRDWAQMIEDRAESAERAAMESLENRLNSVVDRMPSSDDLSEEDLDDLIDRMENADLSDAEAEALSERERAGREAESAGEEAERAAEAERHESAEELNGTINGGIHSWNSGIDTLNENLDVLSDDLGSIRNASDHLIGVSSAYSAELTDDLSAINDQINATYDLLGDIIRGTSEEGVEYLFSDVSETDIAGTLDGRCVDCRNLGSVYGDLNAGGIAGCMSVDTENLESNAIMGFDLKTGEAYAISSILEGCRNQGLVEARTDCGGGIVGKCEHGCVREGFGYGGVRSQDGDHIGGIAGYSEGIVVSSYSACTLSGDEYVGGIAGYASSIKNSISMPVFGDVRGNFGAIAGQILRDPETQSINGNDFHDNSYVAGNYYGIDDISYDGIAGEISYEELLAMDGIPGEFEKLRIIFVADGEIVGIIPATYGDDMGRFDLPGIPDKDESYGVWPDLDGMKVAGNMVVEAEYVSHVAVLRSDKEYEDTGKPLALMQGQFRTSDRLWAGICDMSFAPSDNSAYTDVMVYDINFADPGYFADGTAAQLRIYVPYEECRVWKKTGDSWTEIPSEMVGTYAQITMNESGAFIAVTKTPDETLKYSGYALIAILVVIFLVIIARQASQAYVKSRRSVK